MLNVPQVFLSPSQNLPDVCIFDLVVLREIRPLKLIKADKVALNHLVERGNIRSETTTS